MNIPLNFRQIEILLAVADTGSTAAASRALNTSQPSVSLAIARCEEVFGQKLFVRIPGLGMELTPFGLHKIAQLRELEKQARWVLSGGDALSRICLVGAMAAIGMKTHLKDVLTVGLKPVLLMVIETVFLAVLFYGLLRWTVGAGQ